MRTGIQLLPWLAVTAAAIASSDLDARSLEEHQNVQRSLEDGTWAVKTRSLFDDLGTCSGCQNILALLKGLVKDSDDGLISIGSTLCTTATSYDSDFCKGVVEREGPVIAQAVRAMELNSTLANQFCVTFLGVCDYPEVQTWNVPFPSKQDCSAKRPVPAAKSDKQPIQIIQFSDIHITNEYKEGASTECGRPVCCTGATGNTTHPAGAMADHNCDTSPSLAKSMFDFMNKTFPGVHQITLFTGDIIDHNLANTSETKNIADFKAAFDIIGSKVWNLYGTIGNHEASPANIFYPTKGDNRTQWVYDSLSKDYSGWLLGTPGDKSDNTTREFGGYSYLSPATKLRFISLNTNMYYTFNFALYDPKVDKDPLGQIAWLVGELDAAEKAGENVYLMGHMAPGDVDALHSPSNYLDQVIRRYQNTIRAMFFGHTHWDQFAVSYNDYNNRNADNAMAVSYICPSLTPTSGMPSFRTYDVDPDTYAVLDVTTWYADMTDKSFQSNPTWKKLYSAKEAYGAALSPPVTDPRVELTPAFWHNVTVAMEKNTTLFNDYRSRMSRGWNVTDCKGDCEKDTICELRGGRSQDNCHHPAKGVHFSKRSDADIHTISHTERDECGVPLARDLLHALARSTDMLEMLSKRFVESGAVLEPIVRRAAAASSSSTATATPYECGSAATATGGSSNPKSTSSGALADAVAAPGQLGGLAALAVGLLAL